MRRLTILVALVAVLGVSASEAAKPASKPATGAKPTITKTQTQKGGVTKSSTVKVSTSKGPATKTTSPAGSKAVKPAKTTAVASGAGQTKVAGGKTDAKSAKAEARTSKATSTTTTTTTSGTGTIAPSTIDFTATKVGEKLERNSALRSKIEAKLLAAGYTGSVYEAAYGFKNLGQFNAATNQVQNHGTSFDLLKVLMTGTYVDPVTHNVYRAQTLPDGTTQLVNPELATNTASTQSLGQAKQTITGGAVMPVIVPYTTTGTTATTTSKTSTTTVTSTSKSKPRKPTTATTSGGGL